MYVCVYVCMFQNNSGMPGAISTKLGTHDYIYIYKYYVIYYIYNKITLTLRYR
jgi:hypothetical protein